MGGPRIDLNLGRVDGCPDVEIPTQNCPPTIERAGLGSDLVLRSGFFRLDQPVALRFEILEPER